MKNARPMVIRTHVSWTVPENVCFGPIKLSDLHPVQKSAQGTIERQVTLLSGNSIHAEESVSAFTVLANRSFELA